MRKDNSVGLMSIRTAIAIAAMQGILANSTSMERLIKNTDKNLGEMVAEDAVNFADALIRKLENL